MFMMKCTNMKIYIDDNSYESGQFFFSVPLTDDGAEILSFDYTTKGHRILKQRLVWKRPMPADTPVSAEWDTLLIENGRFVAKEHVRWIDQGKRDWANDEVWEQVWERPMPDTLRDTLLHSSNLIRRHYQQLEPYKADMRNLEQLLQKEIGRLCQTQ